jgi:hypothetical protein
VAFDRFLVLVRAFYEGFKFGDLAKNPSHRQGLVDLLIGSTGTAEAIALTRELAAGNGDET